MSNASVVIVLEGDSPRNIARSLSRWGYSIIVVDNQLKALNRIGDVAPSAAVVDGDDTVDALEFVLNVREIDEYLPIIIVKPSIEDGMARVLRETPEVYFVSTRDDDFQPQVRRTLAESKR